MEQRKHYVCYDQNEDEDDIYAWENHFLSF